MRQQYIITEFQGIRIFFAKTPKIWFDQVVNSVILKVKDISIFAAII